MTVGDSGSLLLRPVLHVSHPSSAIYSLRLSQMGQERPDGTFLAQYLTHMFSWPMDELWLVDWVSCCVLNKAGDLDFEENVALSLTLGLLWQLLTGRLLAGFVLFVCLLLNVERCMWKGRTEKWGEGTVSGRGKVRRCREVGRGRLRAGERGERKIRSF